VVCRIISPTHMSHSALQGAGHSVRSKIVVVEDAPFLPEERCGIGFFPSPFLLWPSNEPAFTETQIHIIVDSADAGPASLTKQPTHTHAHARARTHAHTHTHPSREQIAQFRGLLRSFLQRSAFPLVRTVPSSVRHSLTADRCSSSAMTLRARRVLTMSWET
jgi:hypothetical protein